ncbi:MAG: DUF4336 domain-containing protein [Cyanobacteria bacterium P01_G01_bin.4]
MLEQIDEDVWVAEQPLRYFGVSIRTRMTVLRVASDELAIISPIRLDQDCRHKLDALGAVKHIIAPNLYHYFFVSECKQQYPIATVWAAPGLKSKCPQLPIDRTISEDIGRQLNDIQAVFWDGFRTLTPKGAEYLNEYVFLHVPSRTLILTDAAFNFDRSFPPLTQFAMQVLGNFNRLGPSLLERVATTDQQSLRVAVETVLAWDFSRIIMAHGSIIESNAKDQFRHGYERFLGELLTAAP